MPRELYTMTFAEGYGGPGEITVRLPTGGRVHLSRYDAAPAPEVMLTAEEAEMYAKQGLACRPAKSLEEHSVGELRDLADDEGVDLTGLRLKDDIVKAIRTHRNPLSAPQKPSEE